MGGYWRGDRLPSGFDWFIIKIIFDNNLYSAKIASFFVHNDLWDKIKILKIIPA